MWYSVLCFLQDCILYCQSTTVLRPWGYWTQPPVMAESSSSSPGRVRLIPVCILCDGVVQQCVDRDIQCTCTCTLLFSLLFIFPSSPPSHLPLISLLYFSSLSIFLFSDTLSFLFSPSLAHPLSLSPSLSPSSDRTIAGTTDSPTELTALPMPREEDIKFILSEIKAYLSPNLSGNDNTCTYTKMDGEKIIFLMQFFSCAFVYTHVHVKCT